MNEENVSDETTDVNAYHQQVSNNNFRLVIRKSMYLFNRGTISKFATYIRHNKLCEASLWLNRSTQNVAKGWLST